MINAVLDWQIMVPAFLAGLLVLLTHVPLGRRVLSRGIVFIDLAIAQIAALGVMVADALGWEPRGIYAQIAAVTGALLGALFFTFTEKRWPGVQEAIIGVAFVVAASAGLILLAHNPHGGEHLQDLLAGQILWVGYAQLVPLAIVTALVVTALLLVRDRLNQLGFYLLFAVTVTASVQWVGVYLVFASLIIPALAVSRVQGYAAWVWAYSLGIVGYALGLALSMWWDLPSGSVIVLCLAVLGTLVGAVSVYKRAGKF